MYCNFSIADADCGCGCGWDCGCEFGCGADCGCGCGMRLRNAECGCGCGCGMRMRMRIVNHIADADAGCGSSMNRPLISHLVDSLTRIVWRVVVLSNPKIFCILESLPWVVVAAQHLAVSLGVNCSLQNPDSRMCGLLIHPPRITHFRYSLCEINRQP